MELIERFIIDRDTCIELLVPEFKKKFNYYYEPTPQLTRFDEASVILKDEKQVVVIGFEMLDIVLESLRDACLNILNGEATLSDSLSAGTVGYQYNITTKNEGVSDLYLPIFVWSGPLKPTFLYEKNEKMYLEISPKYPWMYEDPKKGEPSIIFEQFMRSYKPIAVEIVDKAIINQWFVQCKDLLHAIEVNHAGRMKNRVKNEQ